MLLNIIGIIVLNILIANVFNLEIVNDVVYASY